MSNEVKSGILEKKGQKYFPVTDVSLVQGLQDLLSGKQEALVSGENIKTINGESILGSGNIEIQGGGSDEIFVAQYNVTTYAQLSEAYTAGKKIFCAYDYDDDGDVWSVIVPLTAQIDDVFEFAGFMRETDELIYIHYQGEGGDSGWFVDTRNLATVATSGSYNDLTNRPTIPTDLSELSDDSTHRLVTDTEKATWNGKYTKPVSGIPASDIASGVIPDVSGKYEKPSTGIPKTDLAQGVWDSLALADSALQSFTETDPTVPSWAKAQNPPTEIFWATYDTTTAAEITAAVGAGKAVMMNYSFRIYVLTNLSSSEAYFFVALLNNTAYSIACNKRTSAWASYATYVLENTKNRRSSWQTTPDDTHYPSEKLVKDSLDGKQPLIDSTNKLDYSLIDNTPTIPTVPTISTDIQTDKSSTTKTAAPSAVYNEVHPATVSSQPAGGFAPNIFYNLGTLSGNTTFDLATPADANVVNHYYWTFDTGSTAPTITWPTGLTWMGGSAPTINASKHYEISVLNNIGTFMEV